MDRNISEDVSYNIITKSLSARRAWIEISGLSISTPAVVVALRKESVDRNISEDVSYNIITSRSPQGERG